MRLWYLNWETTKGILKPNAPMQAAMRGMLFEFECFAYFKDVSCVKWTVSMHISLFQGYSACRNGGHWSGPRLVPSTQPQSCRSVWTHRAVRHRGAVYHVCRCPPPHEYPLASGFPVCTLPASKTMARYLTRFLLFLPFGFLFDVEGLKPGFYTCQVYALIMELYPSPAFGFFMCGDSYETHCKI